MNRMLDCLLRSAIALSLALSLLFSASPVEAAQLKTVPNKPMPSQLSSASLTPEIPADIPLTVEEKKALEKFYSQDLTANIPADIPLSLNSEKIWLKTQNLFPFLQQLFDRFAWQEFVAINWPLDAQGNPLPKITDKGTPRWLTWYESLQVFRPDGSEPQDDTPRLCPENSGNKRELYLTSSVFSNTLDSDIADEVNQAFTTPLYDQNGKEVRYEVFLNDKEYKYIVENQLYNLDGQIEYSQTHHAPVNFPAGDFKTGEVGAIEIKLAWKQLSERDSPSRFYTEKVLLPELDEKGEPETDKKGNFKSCTEQTMGLVGMHISQKTNDAPQWVWATFEQVDNLNVDETQYSQDGKRLYALFHDYTPAGQTLPVNVPPIKRNSQGQPDLNGVKKTQVSRPIPIPGLAQKVNHNFQQKLAQANSPLQYYQLIDSQWPTAPYPDFEHYGAVAGSQFPDNLPEGITRKSTGAPAPVYLTNSTMETYFQAGNQPAQLQENGFPFEKTLVFGTESCMGCHFSAGIATGYEMKNLNSKNNPHGSTIKVAIFGGDLTADFSWLLQQKAKWKDQKPVLKRALAR